jgi:hypothetical protein
MLDDENKEGIIQSTGQFLAIGIELEAAIEQAGMNIREQAKNSYKQEWLDARMMLVAVISYLQSFRANIPGNTNPNIDEILTLISVFTQGVNWVERLISEGQYVKASAVLKQDYEILTRINEIKAGVAKSGTTPNVKHAPKGSQKVYGDLNNVAHPSNLHLLKNLLNQLHEGKVHRVSAIPIFNEQVLRELYELHIWLIIQIAREAIILAGEMYSKDDPDIYCNKLLAYSSKGIRKLWFR